ncbi:hypothetical protein OPV22_033693 [Ensete ventricosum]|uniref:Auxin-responsive protein n=1 Tax=Ensete ventricosum TaxID=4639 RepID=A0AAV8Q075_ENSVE|nr:hypothetical protein OPV22_033693 [Ensete ventricosum]
MLIINIPTEMFSNRRRRLRIMKISDATGICICMSSEKLQATLISMRSVAFCYLEKSFNLVRLANVANKMDPCSCSLDSCSEHSDESLGNYTYNCQAFSPCSLPVLQ